MGATVKVSEQIKEIRNSTNIRQHTFLNAIAQGIAKQIANQVPGLELAPTGKKTDVNSISIKLVGKVKATDERHMQEIKTKVQETMKKLQGEHRLISLLDE